MNKVRLTVGGAVMFAVILTATAVGVVMAQAKTGAVLVDKRDGKKYRTVKIGEQVWMAENLNYKIEGSKCYGEGGKAGFRNEILSAEEVQKNCDKYGRLYAWDWNPDMKLCPQGWHIPNNAEWNKLYRFADGTSGTESAYTSQTAGKYLKAASGWDSKSGNGTDDYGFAGLPGGIGHAHGSFSYGGMVGWWWSADEGHTRLLDDNDTRAKSDDRGDKGTNLHSVRCIADAGQSSAPAKSVKSSKINPLDMVPVEGGTLKRRTGDVAVSDFSINKYEVTQGLWKEVMGSNPSEFKGDDNRPVEQVSWNDAQEFIKKLNAKTGKNYRLPTSDEWLFAARGGNKGNGYTYAGGNDVDEVAWNAGNSDGKTHPVGTKLANELGIHDMSGNVWEWTGTGSGKERDNRGGAWRGEDRDCNIGYSSSDKPDTRRASLGFRLAHDAAAGKAVTPAKTKNNNVNPLEMVSVEGGTFTGKDFGKVTLSSFSINKYEVTQGLWKEVMGSNPSEFKGDENLPVERVSWNEAQEFIKKLNAKTGKKYRLPTEAEWEYAARGGNKSKEYRYSGSNNADDVAWHLGNSGKRTHTVGSKEANELGIYDMSGNVNEWTNDTHGDSPLRVVRGGCWNRDMQHCIAVKRYNASMPDIGDSNLGFRLAHDAEAGKAMAPVKAKTPEKTEIPAKAAEKDNKINQPDKTPVVAGTFTDKRDGKKYKTVKIGAQTWMAENLNYNADGSKYHKNNTGNDEKYGRLYKWPTALEACPAGWHLPDTVEWQALADYAGGWKKAGSKLKSTSGWYNNLNGTDNYGFSALPGGFGLGDGSVEDAGIRGHWWSATENNASLAWSRFMAFNDEGVSRDRIFKTVLLSVRCVQDERK